MSDVSLAGEVLLAGPAYPFLAYHTDDFLNLYQAVDPRNSLIGGYSREVFESLKVFVDENDR